MEKQPATFYLFLFTLLRRLLQCIFSRKYSAVPFQKLIGNRDYEQDLMSLKFWKFRPSKKFPKRKLLLVSLGSFGDRKEFPFTSNLMLDQIQSFGINWITRDIRDKEASFAFPPSVDISALLMHKPFSRNILVMSEKQSEPIICTEFQFLAL